MCVSLFFFICREEVELEEEDAHLIISRWFIIFKSVEPLTEFYFGWLVCHLCNSSFSRLFPKYFSIWLTGTTTWRRNRRIGRGRARTTHVHARTDLWKGNTTRGEQRGGGEGRGCWNCYQTRSSLVPRRPFWMNSCPVIFAAADVIWLWRSKKKKKKNNRAGTSAAQSHKTLFCFKWLCCVVFCVESLHLSIWSCGKLAMRGGERQGGV